MPAALLLLLLLAAQTVSPQPAPSVPAQPAGAVSPPPVQPRAARPAAPSSSAPRTPPAVIEKIAADIVVEADGTYVMTRAMDVRIDREEAIRGVSTLPISVSRSLQKFELVEAWTETPDRRRVTVSPESVITQAPPYAAQLQTQSDVELKMINFPAVSVGSRLHIVTRITQTTPNFPDAYMFDLAPGHGTIVADGSVRLSVPRAMKLNVDVDGIEGGQPRHQGDRTLYEWRYRVPDYRLSQPGELANIDQSPRLIVTSMADWAALAKAYQDRATEPEKPSPAIRALADRITAPARDDRERVRLLAKWVALNVRYVNIVLGVGGFVPASADAVLQSRFGDCKGHATILNALLAAKGIDATSVLINSTATYREPTVAGQIFNHMINYVPALDMFVDTTDPFALFGDLPTADRGKFVVLTRTGQTKRTPASGPFPDTLTTESQIVVQPDGALDGTTRIRPTGSYVGGMRQLAVAARNQDPALIAVNLMNKNGSPGTGTVTMPDPNLADDAILLNGSWHVADGVSSSGIGAMRVPTPMALESMTGIAASASLPAPTRPITCGAIGLTERTVVRFPDTMTITAVPQAVKVDTPEVTYVSDWKRDGQTVTVSRAYVSHYTGRTCTPETIVAAQAAKRQIARDVAAQIVYQAKETDAAAASASEKPLPLGGRETGL